MPNPNPISPISGPTSPMQCLGRLERSYYQCQHNAAVLPLVKQSLYMQAEHFSVISTLTVTLNYIWLQTKFALQKLRSHIRTQNALKAEN